MPLVIISCCGRDIFEKSVLIARHMSGSVRCSACGCVYGWALLTNGSPFTWTEKSCEEHGGKGTSRLVLCINCKGLGQIDSWSYTGECKQCHGTGLVRV